MSRTTTVPEDPHDPAEHEDIARLRRMSEELVGTELDIRLSDTLPDALIVVNGIGEIVRFNSVAELLFGYNRVEVMGHRVEILIPEALHDQHETHRKGFMENPRSRPMGTGQILSGRHKSGRVFSVQINLAPVVLTTGTFVCAVVRKA